VRFPIAKAALMEGRSLCLLLVPVMIVLVRTELMWSITGMTVAMLVLVPEKNSVASLKI